MTDQVGTQVTDQVRRLLTSLAVSEAIKEVDMTDAVDLDGIRPAWQTIAPHQEAQIRGSEPLTKEGNRGVDAESEQSP